MNPQRNLRRKPTPAPPRAGSALDGSKAALRALLVCLGIYVALSVSPVHAIQADLAGLISELSNIRRELHTIAGEAGKCH